MTEAHGNGASDVCCSPATELAAMIVSAYVSQNSLPAGDLPNLLKNVREAVVATEQPASPAEPVEAVAKPSQSEIKRSITKDALISFVDGQSYKTLKRHLGKHGMTPESYRARYGLPMDYPMVSPGYSEKRSELAKQIGLGQTGRSSQA